MSGLPQGFTAIKDAKVPGSTVSFIGVVVNLQEPRKSRGTDWALNFTIQDDFTHSAVGGGCSSINCRVFKPQNQLPKITALGDVVILRNFKLNAWQERLDCVSTFHYSCDVLVFPASKIPVPELSQAYLLGSQRLSYDAMSGTKEPTVQEQVAVLRLKHSSAGSAQDVQQHASLASFNAAPRRKEALIKDLAFKTFYDIRAQVVNLYYSHGMVELKVTDYTTNKALYLYADPERDSDLVMKRDWPGPYGQLTLDVRLYEPHASFAREHISNGDFVYLRNVHARVSPRGLLEGALHQDRQMPDQVDVRKLVDDPVIDEINKRREAYERQRSNHGTVHLMNAPQKPSAKSAAKRKAEKREKQRMQKQAELNQLEQNEEAWEAERSGINMNSQYCLIISHNTTDRHSCSSVSR
jgi:hypothetical protein